MGKNRSSFSSQLGFILAAAASTVGLGNIWRFPYLAAKDGGGFFILIYLIVAMTFGFTLLLTEIAIGRRTRQGPLTAYGKIHKKWKWIGTIACLAPAIVLPYYYAIGGWVLKYLGTYVTFNSAAAAESSYFSSFISDYSALIWFFIFLISVTAIVITGVEKGIEKGSKILMPILVVMIVLIAGFSLTLSHTDAATNVTRTGLDGFKVYLIPDFASQTTKSVLLTIMDAVGQLFFSISVAMGVMVAYGSYAKSDFDIGAAAKKIGIFDAAVALLAGMMIIPAVFTFMGPEGMAAGGPSLMFITLPKVFAAMGPIVGTIVAIIFFAMTAIAAITSAVSMMEAIVSSLMDAFHMSRCRSSLIVTAYLVIMGVIVCLGYNTFYFEAGLPNGSSGQILDIMDFISNYVAMPIVALATCLMIGWATKPGIIIDEVTQNNFKFPRKKLYLVMLKYICPIILALMLLQSFGILDLFLK